MSSERRGGPQTRAALLAAGHALLLEDGAELSMGAVAIRAGVSRQAAYLHFASRAELVLAVVGYANERAGLQARVRRVLEAEDAVRALDALVATTVWQAAHLGPALRAVRDLCRADASVAEAFRARPGGRAEIARRVVDRLARDGVLTTRLSPGSAAALLQATTGLDVCVELFEAGWSVARVTRELQRAARAALIDGDGTRPRE